MKVNARHQCVEYRQLASVTLELDANEARQLQELLPIVLKAITPTQPGWRVVRRLFETLAAIPQDGQVPIHTPQRPEGGNEE